MKRHLNAFVGGLSVLLAAPASAFAAEGTDRWSFEVTPYLWAAGMEGDVGIGNLQVDGVEANFPDIAKSLRAGFMGSLEARKGAGGIYIDAIYMQLHQQHPAKRGFLGDIDAKATQQAYAIAGLWRVSDGPQAVDLLAGARSNYVKSDLDLSSSALSPQGRTVAKSRTWWDGYVGARVRAPLGGRWTFTGYADIGAGGSDSTWQGSVGVDYTFSPDTTAKFGYRYFKVDYKRDDFLWDMASAGLYAGVGLRF